MTPFRAEAVQLCLGCPGFPTPQNSHADQGTTRQNVYKHVKKGLEELEIRGRELPSFPPATSTEEA